MDCGSGSKTRYHRSSSSCGCWSESHGRHTRLPSADGPRPSLGSPTHPVRPARHRCARRLKRQVQHQRRVQRVAPPLQLAPDVGHLLHLQAQLSSFVVDVPCRRVIRDPGRVEASVKSITAWFGPIPASTHKLTRDRRLPPPPPDVDPPLLTRWYGLGGMVGPYPGAPSSPSRPSSTSFSSGAGAARAWRITSAAFCRASWTVKAHSGGTASVSVCGGGGRA